MCIAFVGPLAEPTTATHVEQAPPGGFSMSSLNVHPLSSAATNNADWNEQFQFEASYDGGSHMA
jgi:hypothetical protein